MNNFFKKLFDILFGRIGMLVFYIWIVFLTSVVIFNDSQSLRRDSQIADNVHTNSTQIHEIILIEETNQEAIATIQEAIIKLLKNI